MKEECKHCRGTGHVYGLCPVCKGKGEVEWLDPADGVDDEIERELEKNEFNEHK